MRGENLKLHKKWFGLRVSGWKTQIPWNIRWNFWVGLMYAGMDLQYNSYFKLYMKVNYRQKLCEYRDMVLWVVTL